MGKRTAMPVEEDDRKAILKRFCHKSVRNCAFDSKYSAEASIGQIGQKERSSFVVKLTSYTEETSVSGDCAPGISETVARSNGFEVLFEHHVSYF
jgi:hypothetical protein